MPTMDIDEPRTSRADDEDKISALKRKRVED